MTHATFAEPPGRALVLICAATTLCCIAPLASAANTSAANARVMIANGTSLMQGAGGPDSRWFAVAIEPGKTYVIEALNPYDDLPSNTLAMGVFAADGASAPPEVELDCNQASRAPSLQVATDGARCVVRALPPSIGGAQAKRAIYVRVDRGNAQQGFQIRARESTIYARWTTNGYDFHIEVQNTTQDAMCVQANLYPDTGITYGGTWSGAPTPYTLNVPPFGAVKTLIASGTAVGGTLKGTMRLSACPSANTNFVPDALHVSAYAYNTATGQYLYFFAKDANGGAAGNSW
jgi:hypothetical protein